MADVSQAAFTFGRNWLQYSTVLDSVRVHEARESVRALLQRPTLEGLTFLDIGAGSGLFSIAAVQLGASVTALDRDTDCVRAIAGNASRFLAVQDQARLQVVTGDVLDASTLPDACYDVVYAWGSLHHTGSMWRAIANAAERCEEGGLFALAIYNDTWSSPLWLRVKQLYHASPRPVRTAMVAGLSGARAAVRVLTGKGLSSTGRGMTLWYDAVDWLGGLPYEYATREVIERFLGERGFVLERCLATRRSGCNEFVFRRTRPAAPRG